jgi:hypothetical protein
MPQRYRSVTRHGSIITRDRKRVPHNLARFDPLTQKFIHKETGEELFVPSDDLNIDYACWFIPPNKTVLLVDGTAIESSQIHCNPETGECFHSTTKQPIQLQPDQVYLLVIDHQNLCNLEFILGNVSRQFQQYGDSVVKTIQVYDFWDGPFYHVNPEEKRWIESTIKFDELRLTKVVKVPDGDFHFFYTKISPNDDDCNPFGSDYNPFGSEYLIKILEKI